MISSRNSFILLLVLFQNAQFLESSHILFMHAYSSYSHRVSTMPLANELVSRGHNVTYIAPMAAEHPNPKIVDIRPKQLTEFVEANIIAIFDISLRINKETTNIFMVMDQIIGKACELMFSSEEFQNWMAASPKVDLIIVDIFPECAVGLAYKLKSKVIVYSTVPFNGKYVDMFGLPDESLTSFADISYKKSMSFTQRIKNTLLPLAWAYQKSNQINTLETSIKKHLNISNLPSFYDLEGNISLVMMCGSFIGEQPRSLPPMFVSVPGLHIKEATQPLSLDIEKFISSTNSFGDPSDGFIYISLGTLAKASKLPESILHIFMNSIRSYPRIRFLWKWDGELPKNSPENLFISKWFQQQDVLGDPRIRGFIFQAGRPSAQEALSNGVPMITFPILADQEYSAHRLEELGVSINLEIGEVTEDQLQSAISRLLYDKEMKSRVQKNSKLFKDLPMKPLETAVWWTEYVLRNEDFSHLKPVARNQLWFQRRNLDVWAVVFLVCLITLFLLLSFARFLFFAANSIISKMFFAQEKLKKF